MVLSCGFFKNNSFVAVTLDIREGPLEDVNSLAVLSTLKGSFAGGPVLGVWLRSPCAAWPVAFSSPQARTSRYVCRVPGIPGLIGQDLQAVQLGNDTLTFSVRVIRACIAAQVPCFLENPQSTLSAPPSCDFASLEFVSDVCQYGAAWRQTRKDCGWWSPSEAPCQHKAGKKLRSRCGRPGRSPQGLCWTEIAEAYPVKNYGPVSGHKL